MAKKLNMKKFLDSLDKGALISRLDAGKGILKFHHILPSCLIDVLFAQKDNMYDAKRLLEEFGIDTKKSENVELQKDFKNALPDIQEQFIEFVKGFYNLEGYELTVCDGFLNGDVCIFLAKKDIIPSVEAVDVEFEEVEEEVVEEVV